MYANHLESFFTNFIKKFEIINAPGNDEYYKWQIVKQFFKGSRSQIWTEWEGVCVFRDGTIEGKMIPLSKE